MILAENIYNFAARTQCCLGSKGVEIIDKISIGQDCNKDKLDFILAHVFNQLISLYSDGVSMIRIISTPDPNIHQIEIGSISFGSHTIELGFSAYTTFEQALFDIAEMINSQEDNIHIKYFSSGPEYVIWDVYTNYDDIIGQTVTLSWNDYYVDGVDVSSSGTGIIPDVVNYGCITNDQLCSMVGFLKKYCKNQTICSSCSNT